MKSGLDYFPLDVSLDAKFELIEAEYGLTGFGVVVHLLQEIYGKAGYYIEWTNEVAFLLAKRFGLGGNVVSEIVKASIRRGMFDKEKYEKYHVLTSKGIQKRYFEAVSRRKVLEIDYNILLVDVAQFCRNAHIIAKNVNILSENVNISEESKVKKSKVEESKADTIPAVYNKKTMLGEAEQVQAALAAVMTEYMDKVTPTPNPLVVEEMQEYVRQLEPNAIIHAIHIAVAENTRKWSYIKGIIQRYIDAGLKTLSDVKDSENAFRTAKGERNKHIIGARKDVGRNTFARLVTEGYLDD